MSDDALDREMAYANQPCADNSCRALPPTLAADLIECRRANGHDGDHAAGFGAGRVRWAA